MSRGKAFRRSVERKIKGRIKRLFKILWEEDSPSPAHIGRMKSTHFKPCSCVFCGNPRKYYGEKTAQERRADIDMKEQV